MYKVKEVIRNLTDVLESGSSSVGSVQPQVMPNVAVTSVPSWRLSLTPCTSDEIFAIPEENCCLAADLTESSREAW